MAFHTVQVGESLLTIAREYGYRDYQRIYDHPKNNALWISGRTPGQLEPQDKVFIPTNTAKSVLTSTNRSLTFIAKKTRRELCLTLKTPRGEVARNSPFVLVSGEWTYEGTTDNDGRLRCQLPHLCTSSITLTVVPGTQKTDRQLTSVLDLHTLAPIQTARGVQRRLSNLGHKTAVNGKLSRCEYRQALHELDNNETTSEKWEQRLTQGYRNPR